jgi:hypothetical protein
MPVFPYKLHQLLEEVEKDEEFSRIISWFPNGKCFKLHSPDCFAGKLLKTYFPRQTQVKSFLRQLQYYGFDNHGDGLYSHPKFVRGQRNLCGQIIHQIPTKHQKSRGKSTRPLKSRGRKRKTTPLPEISLALTSSRPSTEAKDVSSFVETAKSEMPKPSSLSLKTVFGHDGIHNEESSASKEKIQSLLVQGMNARITSRDLPSLLGNDHQNTFLTRQHGLSMSINPSDHYYVREGPLLGPLMTDHSVSRLGDLLYRSSPFKLRTTGTSSQQLISNLLASQIYSQNMI